MLLDNIDKRAEAYKPKERVTYKVHEDEYLKYAQYIKTSIRTINIFRFVNKDIMISI